MASISAFINIMKGVSITMDISQLFLILVGVSVAAAAGYLGTFMVLRRMALTGDALSHVALPGLAIALTVGVSPMIGAFGALFLAIFLIWYLGERSPIYPETLVGVVFTASLALGMLITPEPELLEALFGNIEKISVNEGIAAIALSLIAIGLTAFISKKLTVMIVSRDLAESIGIKTRLINLVYLMLVGTVVALGVKFVGTLLTGALVIVPAAAAKNVSGRMKTFSLLALTFGVLSAAAGIMISLPFHFSTGPMVVLTSIIIFALSYFAKKPARVEGTI